MSRLHRGIGLTRRQAIKLGGGAALVSALPLRPALAADKVIFRTNWLFYGSHSIFFLGIDKGYYVMKLAAQGAPVISVATIDATGTDAVIVNPDSGIKTFKDLEGKKVLTTAGAGVNTLFPVAAQNAGVDVSKIELTNVADSALVQSYLQGLAPAILGGIDDKPAEIEANGGKTPIAFNYADYGVYQPGYAIVAHRDTVKDNPDLVKRFVHATLEAVKEAAANPDEAINSLINWEASESEDKERKQARQVLDVTLSILYSKNNTDKRLGLNVGADWQSALDLLKKYNDVKTDMKASDFYTNDFVPTSL